MRLVMCTRTISNARYNGAELRPNHSASGLQSDRAIETEKLIRKQCRKLCPIYTITHTTHTLPLKIIEQLLVVFTPFNKISSCHNRTMYTRQLYPVSCSTFRRTSNMCVACACACIYENCVFNERTDGPPNKQQTNTHLKKAPKQRDT